MKTWNLLTASALLFIGGGLLAAKFGFPPGRPLVLLGVILFVLSLLGSSRFSARHPLRCPVCGNPVRPAGRWLPGVGYNGINHIPCPHCGTLIPVSPGENH